MYFFLQLCVYYGVQVLFVLSVHVSSQVDFMLAQIVLQDFVFVSILLLCGNLQVHDILVYLDRAPTWLSHMVVPYRSSFQSKAHFPLFSHFLDAQCCGAQISFASLGGFFSATEFTWESCGNRTFYSFIKLVHHRPVPIFSISSPSLLSSHRLRTFLGHPRCWGSLPNLRKAWVQLRHPFLFQILQTR